MQRRHDHAWRGNPFVPGQGLIPPFLAGRGSQQALLGGFLDRLAQKRAPGSDVILIGPRGNGKTALLEWTLRQARARKIDEVEFFGTEIESLDDLTQQFTDRPNWLRALSGVSALGVGVKLRKANLGPIGKTLAARARKRPVLIAIDEAHTLNVGLGRNILNSVQKVRRSGLPVLLVLAGTPDLRRRLNSMEASFWDRSRKSRIGLLGSTDSADAIRIPLENSGRSIESEALARVVLESHGYPFFLQLWGEALWDQAADASSAITMIEVNHARVRFMEARDEFYLDRYDELRRTDLAAIAARVSSLFVNEVRCNPIRVYATIRETLEQVGHTSDERSVMETCDKLHELGYIWLTVHESRDYFEPGIPSFMGFVARCQRQESGSQQH